MMRDNYSTAAAAEADRTIQAVATALYAIWSRLNRYRLSITSSKHRVTR